MRSVCRGPGCFAVVERAITGRATARSMSSRRTGSILVFAEVKLAQVGAYFGAAREFVDARKQEQLRADGAPSGSRSHETRLQPRFDVIEIYAPDGMADETAGQIRQTGGCVYMKYPVLDGHCDTADGALAAAGESLAEQHRAGQRSHGRQEAFRPTSSFMHSVRCWLEQDAEPMRRATRARWRYFNRAAGREQRPDRPLCTDVGGCARGHSAERRSAARCSSIEGAEAVSTAIRDGWRSWPARRACG